MKTQGSLLPLLIRSTKRSEEYLSAATVLVMLCEYLIHLTEIYQPIFL